MAGRDQKERGGSSTQNLLCKARDLACKFDIYRATAIEITADLFCLRGRNLVACLSHALGWKYVFRTRMGFMPSTGNTKCGWHSWTVNIERKDETVKLSHVVRSTYDTSQKSFQYNSWSFLSEGTFIVVHPTSKWKHSRFPTSWRREIIVKTIGEVDVCSYKVSTHVAGNVSEIIASSLTDLTCHEVPVMSTLHVSTSQMPSMT